MQKKILSFLSFIILVFGLCLGTAYATEARASATLSAYSVIAKEGTNSGEIKFTYDVRANSTADSVGISSITIYKSNGAFVETISGTLDNGLLRSGSMWHQSSYTYTGEPGMSYYASVTVYAKIGSKSDSRRVTTDVVTAHSP